MIDYSIQNKKAWEFNAYDFWCRESGAPSERAKKILADPVGALKRYANYFDTYKGIRVANICGSCGKKAVPLAVLGAEITVFDISEDNKRYAEELAEAKTKLVALSNKLTDEDFTSTDVQNLQTFIKEHEELKGASEVETAETRIKMAESILDLCSGNDAALDALLNNTALSENQKKLLRDIK